MDELFMEEKQEVNWADTPVAAIEPEVEKKTKKKKDKKKEGNTAKTKMEVIIHNLEVKDWADAKAPTIATLSKGDIVSVGKEDGDYIEIRLTKAIAGYSLKKFLK